MTVLGTKPAIFFWLRKREDPNDPYARRCWDRSSRTGVFFFNSEASFMR